MTLIKQSSFLFLGMLILIFLITGSTGKAMDLVKGQHQKTEKMKKKERQKIVFLITKDSNNYEADRTIPVFAKLLENKYGYDVTVLLGSGERGSYQYPNIEKVSQADLLVVFARRIALPQRQMEIIKNHLRKGKPLIGIRTANHAFSHSFTTNDKIGEGYEDWPEFVDDILGCKNRGYGPVEAGTDVSIVAKEKNHPILKSIDAPSWHSKGNIYLVAPLLDQKATILLTGKAGDITQPVAWTRTAGKSKVFYTSLGYPADFENAQFNTLLVNAVKWSLSGNQKH